MLSQIANEGDLAGRYAELGYVGPFAGLSSQELDSLGILRRIDALRAASAADDWRWSRNRHLDVAAIAEVCRLDGIARRVRAILGPDLLLWRSQIWGFGAADMGLEWHRDDFDAHMRRSEGDPSCSVQVNLAGSTRTNCLAIIPGSHHWDSDSLRAKGYTAGPGVNFPEWRIPREARVLDLPMRAGEFFIFHPRLLHASVWSRTLRTAGKRGFSLRVARWSARMRGAMTADRSFRYSITLRITTPATEILPSAFEGIPSRASSVLLSGTDRFGLNELGTWARAT